MNAPLASRGENREAARQQALVALLFAPQAMAERPSALGVKQFGARWAEGLAAYRGNGREHARVALRAQFPTVLAMLGEPTFDTLAARHWLARPPRRGDLAWVGEDFADTLAEQRDLQAWPWLADSARLDWALWNVLHARPAALRADDLQRLACEPPQRLRLRLAPGTRLVASRWPIVSLWRLHRAEAPDVVACRDALQGMGEIAWVWREGWQARAEVCAADTQQWLLALQQAPTLEHALQAIDDGDFDPAAWLQQAVRHGWIDTVGPVSATPSIP